MSNSNSTRKLTEEGKNIVAQWLLQHSSEGKLEYGAKKEATAKFHLSLRTVWRIWQAVTAQLSLGIPVHLQSNRVGKQYKNKKDLDEEKVKSLPLQLRTSLRVMAPKLGISKSALHRFVKAEKIIPHTSAIKPSLTEKNKFSRLRWSLSQLQTHAVAGNFKFQSMFNTIHIDEKWFYLKKEKERYYLVKGEQEPHRSCKSKRHIPKIMFSCAVSRPIIDEERNVLFDGKFGIFPFITHEPAKRNSKNRSKGTIEVKPIAAITKAITKDSLLNQMVPVFKAKWPTHLLGNQIFIQQDNAKPHIKPDDPDFLAIANSDGFNFQLICQPPNSPDTNVNDLGFFRAIQSLKDQQETNNLDELIQNVKTAYDNYEPEKINHVFLTLQNCYKEIMKSKGDNKYKIPHMNKERLERIGILPECIEVEEEVVKECLEFLNTERAEDSTSYNLDDIVFGLEQVRIQN